MFIYAYRPCMINHILHKQHILQLYGPDWFHLYGLCWALRNGKKSAKFKITRSVSVLTGLIPPAAANSSFSKSRSKSRSRSLGQKYWYQQKGLATTNIHVKYESPISFGSKVIATVKVFFSKVGQQSRSRLQSEKYLALTERSCHRKYTFEIWSLISFVFKLWQRLSFLKSRSKVKVKVTKSKILVSTERSCHKEY